MIMTNDQNSFFANKVQEIHTNLLGEVIQSSDTIFELEKGANIFELHPFFESMQQELTSGHDNSLAFPCVQLDIDDRVIICDITIKKQREFLAILLFDYSTHYEHLHAAAHEKKTALLNEQAHDLSLKHNEERKEYSELVRESLKNKIIGQLEDVLLDTQKLCKTDLSKEQQILVTDIERTITDLHRKAKQIRDSLEINFN